MDLPRIEITATTFLELLDAAKEARRRGQFAFNGLEDKERVEDLLDRAIAKCEKTTGEIK